MYVFFLFRYLKVNNHASNPFYATLFSRPEYIFMQNDFQKEQYNFYVKGLQAESCDKTMVGEHHEHSIFENLLLNARTRLSFVYYWPQTIQIMFISRLLNFFSWLPSFRAKKILNLYSVN